MMTNRAVIDLYPVVQDLSDAEYGNSSSCCGEVFGVFPLENLLSPVLSPMNCTSMCPCDIGESSAAEVGHNHGSESTPTKKSQDLTTSCAEKKDSIASVATSDVVDLPEQNFVHPLLQRDSYPHNNDEHHLNGTSSGKLQSQGPLVVSPPRRKKLHIRRRSRQLMNLLLVRSNSIGSSTITETSMESQQTSVRFHEKYILTQRMSQGRNSEVWQALDRQYGALHCVKTVLLDFAEDDAHAELEMHHALMDQVRRLELTQQPAPDGIVRLVESFEEKSRLYMVLEFLDGGDLLSKVLKEGPMMEEEVNRITKSVVGSLCFLHSYLNVAHGNLEPSNICLTSGTATTKLVDFGSAVNLNMPLNTPHGSLPHGNESCVAPEVLLGRDMYSLGILILFMLTGSSPNMKKVFRGEYKFPSSLSRPAKQFISSLLLIDPSVRMTAAEALKHPWLREGEKVLQQFRRKSSLYRDSCTSHDLTVGGHGNMHVGGEPPPNQGSTSTKHHRRLSSLSKGISKLFSTKEQSSTQNYSVAHPNEPMASCETFTPTNLDHDLRSPSTLTVSSWVGSGPQSVTKKHHRRLVTG